MTERLPEDISDTELPHPPVPDAPEHHDTSRQEPDAGDEAAGQEAGRFPL